MMTTPNMIVRPGLTAIAAVLALSSTPLLAQDLAPAADSVPVESTPTVTETPAATIADPLAPVESEPTVAPTAAESSAAARSPARATATRSPATAANRNRAPAAAPTAPVAAAPATVSADPSLTPVPPIAPEALAASPMTPEVAAPTDTDVAMVDLDQALPIAGAAGLALVGFAGIGLAMRRRRRNAAARLAETDWNEPAVARAAPVREPAMREPAPAPAFASRPAFNWGKPAAPVLGSAVNGSRIEAAYRGPTPENPFLSLKKRLRRAAFFDQRDRAVRHGTARPISPTAGLPTALARKASSLVRSGNITARPAMVPA